MSMLRTSLLLVSLVAIGCSSSGGSSGTGGTGGNNNGGQDGLDGPGSKTGAEGAKNPYGDLYPTSNIGIQARAGSRAGNIMQNFKFRGYKTTPGSVIDPNGTLETIQLADFYDPNGKSGFKVLHIQVGSVWCGPCNEEADQMAQVAADLAKQGALFLTALADGAVQGKGATVNDLNYWIGKHKSNNTHVLDPSLQNFGSFFDAAAVPFNANIDLRSMEILSAGTGFSGDMAGEVQPALDWVNSHPAQKVQ